MIAICAGPCGDGHTKIGVRYDPKTASRDDHRCPLCGGALRARRPDEPGPGCVVTGKLRGTMTNPH